MFQSSLSSTCTEPRSFPLSAHPTSKQTGGAGAAGRGHSQDSWPQLTKGMFCTVWRRAQRVKLGDEGGRGGTFGVLAFGFPSNHYAWRSPALLEVAEHLPADGDYANEFLGLLYLHTWILLYLLNHLYLNPWVFLFLLIQLSPPFQRGGRGSTCLSGARLPAGVKPQELSRYSWAVPEHRPFLKIFRELILYFILDLLAFALFPIYTILCCLLKNHSSWHALISPLEDSASHESRGPPSHPMQPRATEEFCP